MVGEQIIFANGSSVYHHYFTDSTHLIVSLNSQIAANQNYRIKIGLQVTSAGNVGIGNCQPSFIRLT